ncbi:pentatricopeptide repeat-containing protein At4g02750-like [Selaginella moellendorffii]|uniref:pentatricopeptide repeat-containing protein At4g02750-like n=1 Tax=Selaginella moellendorffii TaxID=88036 RepID=UPI000D1CBE2B|nr:pentatricopeptide repeat-containing protein At4g02750-like [Selaginella moellendorffii]|eukprot:XP_024543601.1 pentatricopeptide repeat-containing protein At4g02750-like [Selaginella moellendorffii]
MPLPASPEDHSADRLARFVRGAKDLAQARKVHSLVLGSSYSRDRYLANLLVHMYGKCGSVRDARQVFDAIDRPNVVAFNIMLATYAQNGYLDDARLFFDKMPQRNVVSWNALVSAQAQHGFLEEARRTFSRMPSKDVASWNIMITAAARDGDLKLAKQMFDGLQAPNQVSWNAMISAYVKNGDLKDARELFERMPSSQRNAITWTTMVMAYARAGYMQQAHGLFDRLAEEAEEDHGPPPELWNFMITAYSRRSQLQDAKELFDKMPRRDRVSWRAMVSAYAESGHPSKALLLLSTTPFEQDLVCQTAIIVGYGRVGDLEAARKLFDKIPNRDTILWNAIVIAAAHCGDFQTARHYFQQTPDKNVQSWNGMISCLAQHNRLDQARDAFDQMPHRDVVSWTVMLTAYSQSGYHREAFLLFRLTDLEGMDPDAVALACAFDACASFSSSREGRDLHGSISGSKLEKDLLVANAMINMYGKFGLLDRAEVVFERMNNADAVSWNAMITAFAQNGLWRDAERCYSKMQCEGLQPDGITFLALLSASVHAGSLSSAWCYFVAMELDYELVATAEHFKCMVDLLGRSGRVEEAEELAASMPFHPNVEEWTSILNARKIHGAKNVSIKVAQNLHQLDPCSPLPYILG